VAQALARHRLLTVLDACEHVIAAVAVAEAMREAGSALHIIAPAAGRSERKATKRSRNPTATGSSVLNFIV